MCIRDSNKCEPLSTKASQSELQQRTSLHSKHTQKRQIQKSRRSSIPAKSANKYKDSIDYYKAAKEFSKNPATNPEDRLSQINQLVKASSKLIKDWEHSKPLATLNHEFAIQRFDGKNSDGLKIIVADQIQKLLSVYKEMDSYSSNSTKSLMKCNESSIKCNESFVKDESLMCEKGNCVSFVNENSPNKYMELISLK
eukprot:TRINITY_DN15475_c0_g1_i7.p1 TRINITY_DN15475_c0_g1~~TRINITY_DN15475_c0_g1_i7.p1  ORF type:complete len:197 (-),score=19.29 TRINITY_DN15475_c0_g1_i7:53-643(-)